MVFKMKGSNVARYHFWFNSRHIQASTHQPSLKVARRIEAKHREALSLGEAGIFERGPVPTLQDFEERFVKFVETRSATKPKTVLFYKAQFAKLCEHQPLGSARLDAIHEALIESYVQHRSRGVSAATVNRDLAVLRRALRMAQEWRVIDRVPRIRMMQGEKTREFVLSHEDETRYLEAVPQPLRDIALLVLDTGLRMGEARTLAWKDVHLEPAGDGQFGYIHVPAQKSKKARNVPLTDRASDMLRERRKRGIVSLSVFGEDGDRPMLTSSFDHLHLK
jgi:integrase